MTDHSLEQGLTSVTPTLHDEPLDPPIEKTTQHSDPEHDEPSNSNSIPLGVMNEKQNVKSDEDILIVDWDGPDDPQNPKK